MWTSRLPQTRQEIASLDDERAQAQTILNQPQNRDVADQSAFLNNLFARKALSWTRVFAQMEKMMPANIHVVSMKPEFNRENQLVLHVVVATPSREKAVELVKRMEESPHFRSPQVVAENALGEGPAGPGGGNIQFEIAAVYVPFADDSDATPDEAPAKKAGNKSAANTMGVGPSHRRRALMASIREVRKMLMPVLIGLVVIDLACVGYLLSPLGRSREARQRDLEGLKVQLAAKRKEVLPARGMDGKLKQASTDIGDFLQGTLPGAILRGFRRVGQAGGGQRSADCRGKVRRQGRSGGRPAQARILNCRCQAVTCRK